LGVTSVQTRSRLKRAHAPQQADGSSRTAQFGAPVRYLIVPSRIICMERCVAE
jgi:hypothetical protein